MMDAPKGYTILKQYQSRESTKPNVFWRVGKKGKWKGNFEKYDDVVQLVKTDLKRPTKFGGIRFVESANHWEAFVFRRGKVQVVGAYSSDYEAAVQHDLAEYRIPGGQLKNQTWTPRFVHLNFPERHAEYQQALGWDEVQKAKIEATALSQTWVFDIRKWAFCDSARSLQVLEAAPSATTFLGCLGKSTSSDLPKWKDCMQNNPLASLRLLCRSFVCRQMWPEAGETLAVLVAHLDDPKRIPAELRLEVLDEVLEHSCAFYKLGLGCGSAKQNLKDQRELGRLLAGLQSALQTKELSSPEFKLEAREILKRKLNLARTESLLRSEGISRAVQFAAECGEMQNTLSDVAYLELKADAELLAAQASSSVERLERLQEVRALLVRCLQQQDKCDDARFLEKLIRVEKKLKRLQTATKRSKSQRMSQSQSQLFSQNMESSDSDSDIDQPVLKKVRLSVSTDKFEVWELGMRFVKRHPRNIKACQLCEQLLSELDDSETASDRFEDPLLEVRFLWLEADPTNIKVLERIFSNMKRKRSFSSQKDMLRFATILANRIDMLSLEDCSDAAKVSSGKARVDKTAVRYWELLASFLPDLDPEKLAVLSASRSWWKKRFFTLNGTATLKQKEGDALYILFLINRVRSILDHQTMHTEFLPAELSRQLQARLRKAWF